MLRTQVSRLVGRRALRNWIGNRGNRHLADAGALARPGFVRFVPPFYSLQSPLLWSAARIGLMEYNYLGLNDRAQARV